jgi:HSP20 family molecular chaperone IbpA
MADLTISHSAQSQQLRDANDEFESRKQDLRADHEARIREMQKAFSKHEAEVRDSGDAAISHIRKDSQARVQAEAGLMQENADQVLARTQQESKQKIKSAQDQGGHTAEGLQRQYSKAIVSTQMKGESELKDTKEKYERELKSEDGFYQGQLGDEKKKFTEEQKKSELGYEAKRQETAEIQRKSLQELGKKYNEDFVKNDGQNKESMTNQKQTFLKELYRQQQQFATKATMAAEKTQDPFYQSRNLEAQFSDVSGAYVLTAKIPKFERNNYDVHVKDDKVILESYRSSETKSEDKNEKTSTNSYQTHRQEFKMDFPVNHQLVVKQIDDDGHLTVTIPKKILKSSS